MRQQVEARVRNVCLLGAPTGCASYLLKFGASTLHRSYGIPVGFCGAWKDRASGRFRRMKTRLSQARLFVIDEMSMVGRQMLGKIEFKVWDTLRGAPGGGESEVLLQGRDAVLAGDPKQASPIGDEPMYKEGDYGGKGQNKPRGSEGTPGDAWTTKKLVRMGMAVRQTFQDVALLRQVHRYTEEKEGLAEGRREEYRRDAGRFLSVTRGMADCTWTRTDHAWLSRRNRSVVQQTREGREELARFETAPLLMDGRKDRVTGEVGANRVNQQKLEALSARTQKPIVLLRALHDRPDTPEGRVMKPELMDAEDFRGIEGELAFCEGARVLLTQNLWVEAGLMNGALGVLRGYMWPEGGDPHSEDPKKRSPLCVFVEFDSVNLGVDEAGRERTFFPDDPPAGVPGSRRNWVPIWRQQASSTVEDNVSRENYPLTLAWALTHWKAQGMTLEKVRVHLSDRTAGVAGIGFVACTRVRHPWDLIFEADLPEYEAFMRARRTPAFRERRRFELKQEARASRTLRRYGYCEADVWSAEERDAAEALLQGLATSASEQRERLRMMGRSVDFDSWLWGEKEPDVEGELAQVVARVAGSDEGRRGMLEQVAERLLDRVRVRVASDEERRIGWQLLESVACPPRGERSEETWRRVLRAGVEEVGAGEEEGSEGRRRAVADLVARRLATRGCWPWDEHVEDGVPAEIQPLHMSAVREALGALIPERMQRSLDQVVQRGKDDFGAARGGSVLCVDNWRVNVRAEDSLARGRLQADALEFFLLVLKHVCKGLKLPLAIGSMTVGKEVGRQEQPARLAQVMEKWRKVWARDEVREREEFLLPVALDERPVPEDWVCVAVRSCVAGEKLGSAGRIHVEVFDALRRVSLAKRVARNVDVLIRGVGARAGTVEPRVSCVETTECRVGAQRNLCALGLLAGRVAVAAEELALDPKSGSFVADVGHVLRAVFAFSARRQGSGAYGTSLSF